MRRERRRFCVSCVVVLCEHEAKDLWKNNRCTKEWKKAEGMCKNDAEKNFVFREGATSRAGAIGELEKQVSMRRERRRFCVSCVVVLCEHEAKDLWKNNRCTKEWKKAEGMCKNDAEKNFVFREGATSRAGAIGELEKQVSMRRERRRFCVSCVVVLCEHEAKDLWKNNRCTKEWKKAEGMCKNDAEKNFVCTKEWKKAEGMCKNDAEKNFVFREGATSRAGAIGELEKQVSMRRERRRFCVSCVVVLCEHEAKDLWKNNRCTKEWKKAEGMCKNDAEKNFVFREGATSRAGAIGELEKQVSMRRERRRFCVSCVVVLCEHEAKDLWKNNRCTKEWKKAEGMCKNDAEKNFVSGTDILFWLDTWVGNSPLRIRFPALFLIERFKGFSIAERVNIHDGGFTLQFQWSKSELTVAEEDEIVLLFKIIGSVGFNQGSDGWKWNLGKEAVFTVQSIKEALHNNNHLWSSTLF
ncbi:hypothetical protein E3N88_09388 [Mikania micrantha]|uniref:Uncharacterized protein n=1 Tax=Mikania micrantha TaxID=192012 RepID=A0A5N6PJL4_9ASTR|nr:hypothetical protein E3N88_09388 [Mikania micrantha]